jgi:hypothetical protein
MTGLIDECVKEKGKTLMPGKQRPAHLPIQVDALETGKSWAVSDCLLQIIFRP